MLEVAIDCFGGKVILIIASIEGIIFSALFGLVDRERGMRCASIAPKRIRHSLVVALRGTESGVWIYCSNVNLGRVVGVKPHWWHGRF